eukprot:1019914-Pyramimonas_sp.AAC.1
MDNKKQQWQQVWHATETSDDILQALNKAKAAAVGQPLEPITAEQVHRIHGRMPPSKAHGVDALGPRDLHRLPEPAVEAYAD